MAEGGPEKHEEGPKRAFDNLENGKPTIYQMIIGTERQCTDPDSKYSRYVLIHLQPFGPGAAFVKFHATGFEKQGIFWYEGCFQLFLHPIFGRK